MVFQDFVPRLKDHLLARIQNIRLAAEDLDFSEAERDQLVIDNDILYEHATAQFNYTTYDARREYDIIKPKSDKSDIIVTSGEEDVAHHPFWYARVLGVYHTKVSYAPTGASRSRVDFLHIRWLGLDPEWNGGQDNRRMHRIGFVPFEGDAEGPAFGFIDPATVIRACHLIPAFTEEKTTALLPPSKFRDAAGEYVNYFVNQ